MTNKFSSIKDLMHFIAKTWLRGEVEPDRVGPQCINALETVLVNEDCGDGKVGYTSGGREYSISHKAVLDMARGRTSYFVHNSIAVLTRFAGLLENGDWDRKQDFSSKELTSAKLAILEGVTKFGRRPSSSSSASEPVSLSTAFPGNSDQNDANMVRTISHTPSIRGGFRRFCATEIPYFSREDFSRIEPVSVDERQTTEASILRKLENPGETTLFLIQGPSGVGKTRLMLEIGERLKRVSANTLYGSPYTTPEEIKAVLDTLEDDERTYLLFDYVETVQEFPQIADAVAQHNDQALDSNVVIVGCLRASHYNRVLKELRNVPSFNEYYESAESIQEIRLQQSRGGDFEGRFQVWLCDQILQAHFGDGWEELRIICGETPALAAFIAYTSRRLLGEREDSEPSQSDRVQSLVAGSKDFKQWFLRKIKASVHQSTTDGWLQGVAKFFAVLPMHLPPDRRSQIVPEYTFDVLLDDGWIEASVENDSDERVETVHDIFVDTALHVWTEECSSTRSGRLNKTKELCDTASLALKYGLLPSFVRNLNRTNESYSDEASSTLSEEDRQALSSFAKAIVAENAEQVEAALPLLRADFISLQARFRLAALAVEKNIGVELINRPLLKLLEWSRGQELYIDEADMQAVIGGIKAWVGVEKITHFRLVRALNTSPEHFFDDLIDRINSGSGAHETLPLLVAATRSALIVDNGEKWFSDILPKIRYWLAENQQNVEARLLFLECMSATHKIGGIKDLLLGWLQYPDNARDFKTYSIFTTWLKCGGSPAAIMEPLRQWLKDNRRPSAPIVLRAWLTAAKEANIQDGQQASIVKPYVMGLARYIGTEGATLNPTAQYAALDVLFGAPGVAAEVRSKALKNWLSQQDFTKPDQFNPRAQQVFSAWLYSTRELQPVLAAVIGFLNGYHEFDPQGFAHDAGLRILFLNLLKSCGRRNQIKLLEDEIFLPAHTWFNAQDFSSFSEAHHFLQEAIRSGFLGSLSKEAGLAWLETKEHRATPYANDVLHALHVVLDQLSELEIKKLDGFRQDYLNINYLHIDAGEIIADSLERAISPSLITKAECWLRENYPNERSLLPAVRIFICLYSGDVNGASQSNYIRQKIRHYIAKHIVGSNARIGLDVELSARFDNMRLSKKELLELISARALSIDVEALPLFGRLTLGEYVDNTLFKDVIFKRIYALSDDSLAQLDLAGLMNAFHKYSVDLEEFKELSYRWANFSNPTGSKEEFFTILYWVKKSWDTSILHRFYQCYTAHNKFSFKINVGRAVFHWMHVQNETVEQKWCQEWVKANQEDPGFCHFLLGSFDVEEYAAPFKSTLRNWIMVNQNLLQDPEAPTEIKKNGPIIFSNYLRTFEYDLEIIEAIINEDLYKRFKKRRTYIYFTEAFRSMRQALNNGPLSAEIGTIINLAAEFEKIICDTPGYDPEKDTLRSDFVQSREALVAKLAATKTN